MLWLLLMIFAIAQPQPDLLLDIERTPNVAFDSDEACLLDVMALSTINVFNCHGGSGDESLDNVVVSYEAQTCNYRDYGYHGRYKCRVLRDLGDCTQEYLQRGMNGEFHMICPRSTLVELHGEGETAKINCRMDKKRTSAQMLETANGDGADKNCKLRILLEARLFRASS